MRQQLFLFAIASAAVLAACGGDASTRTATSTKPAPTATRSAGTSTPTPLRVTPTAIRGTSTPAPVASATSASTSESGIEGLVTIGPTCPVQRIDSPCPDRAFATDIIVLDSTRQRVASVSSGADGRFRIALPPGSYTLSPQHKGTPPSAPEQVVTVVAGRLTTVQIVYDSGIR